MFINAIDGFRDKSRFHSKTHIMPLRVCFVNTFTYLFSLRAEMYTVQDVGTYNYFLMVSAHTFFSDIRVTVNVLSLVGTYTRTFFQLTSMR